MYTLLGGQAQHGPDRLNKSRFGSDEDLSARPRNEEPDRCLERRAGLVSGFVRNRPIHAYDPSLVDRHSFRS